MSDPFAKFVEAQAPVLDRALAELRAGRKQSHWMWFVFPQLAGLGRSAMAQRYALSGLDQARAYLEHDVLGPRLAAATQAILSHVGADGRPNRSAHEIFGFPDDLKFHSSMTLFHLAALQEKLFKDALDAYFDGALDAQTTARI